MGPRGPDPPLLQLTVAFIHIYVVLNNIDVVITIIYSQKYRVAQLK